MVGKFYDFGEKKSKEIWKKGKGKKFDAPEPEEEEFPENEEYDEELTNDEDWDDEEEAGSRYAPINTKITITKVCHPKLE